VTKKNKKSARTKKPSGISSLRVPPTKTKDADVLKFQEASRQRLGYVRNFLQLPWGPGRLSLYQGYIDLLMRGEDGRLPARERELLALVTSVENRCEVCVISHASALERMGMDKPMVDLLCVSWRRAGLAPREHALAEFAWRLTTDAAQADESYLDILRDAGLSELEIMEAAQVVAIFNANNRFNSVLGVRVNAQAHEGYRKR
jgi:uncharacterized peroxidase-related enzyme